HLAEYSAEVGDMRDLGRFASCCFDRVISCSVLEHLTCVDQKQAVAEMARVLAPGGLIGITFDYGPPAPGANRYLPPPHEPPQSVAEVRERFVHSGLVEIGGGLEEPVPGSLFSADKVSYTIGVLMLA